MGISFNPIYQMNQKDVGFERGGLESGRAHQQVLQKTLGSYNSAEAVGLDVDTGALWSLWQVLLAQTLEVLEQAMLSSAKRDPSFQLQLLACH